MSDLGLKPPSNGVKHDQSKNCPLCFRKLKETHPALIRFFNSLKLDYPDVHVSWGYRDEASQNEAFSEGRSQLRWPHSKHNACKSDGTPCSRAVDLFQISEDGIARFAVSFYREVSEWVKVNQLPVVWGGSWDHFKDYDHFQLADDVEMPVVLAE